MAELTIVFRLRFAVALATAVCIFLAFSVAHADATATRGEYIVQMKKGTSPAAGKRLVRRLGGRVTSPTLRVINGFGAALTKKAVRKLRRHRRVKAVSLNRGMEASTTDVSGGYACPSTDATTVPAKAAPGGILDPEVPILNAVSRVDQPFLKSIRADAAWTRATGRGVGVAVIDTGIAGDVPDFQTPRNGSRVIASAVTNPCARDANDQYGHGTHVAGLIAGNGLVYNNGLHGKYMGVAPRANLVSVKVSDDDGNTTVLDVIYGIQFAVDNKSAYGIRVMNLSLSSTTAESHRTDPLDAAVESAWFSGIVVVTAAGNEAETSDGVTFAPANDPWVITAGALDDKGTFTRLDDALASWSSHGLTQDGVAKPEVLAPGARLVSTLAPGSDFADLCSGCITDNGRYFRAGGTSMASAVVSGAAALLVEAHPDWTPAQVKGALVSKLVDVPGAGGGIDIAGALDASSTFSVNLAPNTLIDPTTGQIDWARASFRRASFRDASGSPLSAMWSRASFRCDCGFTDSGEVDPTRVSFRRVSFRKTTDLGG
ncbi:MAG TPA: S8 family serine peptidase [Thermoleophilaceae bacterium]|nr:S8 family serine peptidase [Thermoleophilaceae bacterium]